MVDWNQELFGALVEENLAKVKTAVMNGADLNRLGGILDNTSALNLATSKGNTDIVEFLLECGGDVNETDGWGISLLMNAAMHGREETVRFLLEKGADKYTKDERGESALSIAVRMNHSKTVGGAHIDSHKETIKSLAKTKKDAELLYELYKKRSWDLNNHRAVPMDTRIIGTIFEEEHGFFESKQELLEFLKKIKGSAEAREFAKKRYDEWMKKQNEKTGELQKVKMRKPKKEKSGKLRRMERMI
ncbi:ankyrin repeat domain-containing protein [Candidatus Micrarchaeota archaeon]|nr:ankyrin repeat domain-containing protein [Candidatus Micrarchaeota archaeon]